MSGGRGSWCDAFVCALTWFFPVLEIFFYSNKTHDRDWVLKAERKKNLPMPEFPDENMEEYWACTPESNETETPGSPDGSWDQDYTSQWKVTKPGELQFLFFEDQELRKFPPRGTIGDTCKRKCTSRPDTDCVAKRRKK